MISKLVALASALVLASVSAGFGADEVKPVEQSTPRISVPTIVRPNELRTYNLSVGIKGCVAIIDSKPLLVDAVNTMKLLHQYGARAGDGLLQLDISARNVQATINGEKAPAVTEQFPKLTLLLDKNWKLNRLFGADGTRYAGQVPGLNYANLIMLFIVPDLDKEHAIGEKWTSKVKNPGKTDEITISSTIKSRDEAAKTVALRQEYSWSEMKLDEERSVKCSATVDSTFDSTSGKLLKSHAECRLPFSEPSQAKPENRQYVAVSTIDIVLEK